MIMRFRYQHLLVPIDFHPQNQWAIDVALEIAQVNSARVTLVHVVESIDAIADDHEIQEFLNGCVHRAEIELERLAQPFDEIGIPIDFRALKGHRISDIVTYANERAIDLIVLSSHPLDPQNLAQSLATPSYQISMLAPCSVLLVKHAVIANNTVADQLS